MPETTVERDFLRWRQACDAQALGRVFDALAPELLMVANHVAGRAGAEDLLQGTFLQAIQHAERWDATRPLLPWLVGILVRLALRERDRQTLTLRLVHGLEPTAIAHALGAPVATVKSRLQRGMELLRQRLPAGLSLPGLAIIAPRGLAEVRAVVFEQAAKVTATVAATATVSGAGIGAMLVMNKMSVTLVAGLALTGALALVWLPSDEPTGRQEVPVAGRPAIAAGTAPGGAPAASIDAASRNARRWRRRRQRSNRG